MDYENKYHDNINCRYEFRNRPPLDLFTKYDRFWKNMGFDDFYISYKLFNFFYENDITIIRSIFRLSNNITINNDKKIYKTLYKFNNLRESDGVYLLYGKNNRIKIGKFFRLFLTIIYGDNYSFVYSYVDIENFVNSYKTRFGISTYKVSILTGDDILLGYNRKFQKNESGTMLNNSCMNDKPNSYFKIYTNNPGKIFLFVVTDYTNKIISRNIIWKIDKYNNYIFDRIYSTNKYVTDTIVKLATQEDYITRDEIHDLKQIIIKDKGGNIKKISKNRIVIKLNLNGVKEYPFIDTFRYHRKYTNKLSNKIYNHFCDIYDDVYGGKTSKGLL